MMKTHNPDDLNIKYHAWRTDGPRAFPVLLHVTGREFANGVGTNTFETILLIQAPHMLPVKKKTVRVVHVVYKSVCHFHSRHLSNRFR